VIAHVLALFAALALVPMPGMAQTPVPDPGADLLQPSLQDNPNPNNPPRFNPPGNSAASPAGKFTAPSRIGATPVYGSPTGFGAGDTGFDSSNRPHRNRTAKTPATGTAIAPAPQTTFDNVPAPPLQVPSRIPVLASPPPAVVYPAKAASRPGAVLPPPSDPLPLSNPPAEVHPASAANRPGAILPIPPPLDFSASSSTPPPGTPQPNTLPLGTPSRPLPIAGADPYEALGIKAGSFLILPSLELSGGYDNNPQHIPGGPGSATVVVAPELQVRSDWSRHAFTADITGSYYWYGNESFTPSLNRPYFNSKLDGRIDVTRDTHILLENRVIVSTDNPGSPNIQAGLVKLPIDTTLGGTLGLDQQLSRFDVTLKGTLDRSVYQDSQLTNGESANNDWRAFDQYAGILRVGYEIDPGVKPFVEVSADTRIHDSPVDIFGEDRDSNGLSGKVGAVLGLRGSLTGEMSVGYLQRDYKDPTLPTVGGATLDGSLIWQATPLTTAKFTAASAVNESILQGVSGSFSRDFNIEVDHAFRTWLIATAKAGYGRDEYAGLARDDNRYFTSVGLIYKLNREMQLKGELRHDWLTSNAVGVAYEATSFLAGLRLQR